MLVYLPDVETHQRLQRLHLASQYSEEDPRNWDPVIYPRWLSRLLYVVLVAAVVGLMFGGFWLVDRSGVAERIARGSVGVVEVGGE